jgi:hypothetical protein
MFGVIPVRKVFVIMAVPNDLLIPVTTEGTIFCAVAVVVFKGIIFIEYNFIGGVRIIIAVAGWQ